MNFTGEQGKVKKLLILGANEETKPFVEAARKMGIYTIVTDHIPGSPAKKIADKSYDINGKDIDGLKMLVEHEKVDGVLVGVADPLVPSYMEIANEFHLPCYVNKDNIDFLTDKRTFKRECREAGIDVVTEYYAGEQFGEIPLQQVEYPCIVKPSRGRGGKGVFLCRNTDELKKYFSKATRYSDNRAVIVEQYMDCRDISVNYFFVNGSAYLIGISDRKTLKEEGKISPVTFANVYPSELTGIFQEQCDAKFRQLFKKLHMNNGILEMQVFWDGQRFYPYDPACILGGELSGPIFPEVIGVNLIDRFIKFALTGNMGVTNDIPNNPLIQEGKVAQSVWILLKPGRIGKIEGFDAVGNKAGVLRILQRLNVGDEVTEEMFGTEKSALGRIWISADSKVKLQQLESAIRDTIKVYDENGGENVCTNTNSQHTDGS